ncbi:MAG: prephenate dehydrogenase/arogenate dehydrogenase family protein [Anaerolineae bacterium]|nr:prephenate dehydrogenase/arogenate dehydrogenase family protein [Caldilineales bacterium]MDW8269453.1 prephenate dehydrogenase/arogenate dehydrogenase family protein [Anaerolineae bacterium]
MPDRIQITIVGLGLIGTSFGLALKRHKRTDLFIVGHDKEPQAMAAAKERGAVDGSHWNLVAACAQADGILLALPAAAIPPTLEAICQDLKPGCFLMDTATIKTPILEAARVLPAHVHFIGGNPILTRSDLRTAADATADLFENVAWALCPTSATLPEAVEAAADLVTLVGAKPFFLDAAEHDGLMAAVEGLPILLAAALTNALGGSPGWRELRRLAGGRFETASALPVGEPGDMSADLAANRGNVLRWLDLLIAQLEGWRQDLAAADDASLADRFVQADALRREWLAARASGEFEDRPPPTELPSYWSRFFGRAAFGLASRRPGR